MNAAQIRLELLEKIEPMTIPQLKEFYGFFQNYFNNKDIAEGWDNLTTLHKAKIEQGIAQADAGNTKPLREVTSRLRQKYKLNG